MNKLLRAAVKALAVWLIITIFWAALSHHTGVTGPAEGNRAALNFNAKVIDALDRPGALDGPLDFAAAQLRRAGRSAERVASKIERSTARFMDEMGHSHGHRVTRLHFHDGIGGEVVHVHGNVEEAGSESNLERRRIVIRGGQNSTEPTFVVEGLAVDNGGGTFVVRSVPHKVQHGQDAIEIDVEAIGIDVDDAVAFSGVVLEDAGSEIGAGAEIQVFEAPMVQWMDMPAADELELELAASLDQAREQSLQHSREALVRAAQLLERGELEGGALELEAALERAVQALESAGAEIAEMEDANVGGKLKKRLEKLLELLEKLEVEG